jgi:ribonucleotide monophosphatase NagD (HAD superfamily)
VNYLENFVTLFEKNMISECYIDHGKLVIFLTNGQMFTSIKVILSRVLIIQYDPEWIVTTPCPKRASVRLPRGSIGAVFCLSQAGLQNIWVDAKRETVAGPVLAPQSGRVPSL